MAVYYVYSVDCNNARVVQGIRYYLKLVLKTKSGAAMDAPAAPMAPAMMSHNYTVNYLIT